MVTDMQPKRTSKARIKSSTVAIYLSVFTLLVAVIAVGYRAPEEAASSNVAPSSPLANTATNALEAPTINDVVATNIAASVAVAANLAVAPNVLERAVSTRVQNEYASSSDSTLSKPAIIQLSAASRNISTYTVVAGDTASTVAAKFGLTVDTIKWANNLVGDALTVGAVLDILPRNGIVYTVKSNDTIQSIATKYKADAAVITTYNDLEINGISAGLKIIVPNGVLPQNERPGYVQVATFITGYSAGFSTGRTWFISYGTPNNGRYAPGNCTAYAFDRRAAIGRPIGPMWGNAGSWATNARAAGYTVNKTPAVGAVIQDWGHVAIVEAILPNGDLELSEMNASVSGGGYNIVSGRILSASAIGQYYYIH